MFLLTFNFIVICAAGYWITGKAFNSNPSIPQCQGSLSFFAYSSDEEGYYLSHKMTVSNRNLTGFNCDEINEDTKCNVEIVVSTGGCCWKIYGKTRYRGRALLFLDKGDKKSLPSKPKSAKNVKC